MTRFTLFNIIVFANFILFAENHRDSIEFLCKSANRTSYTNPDSSFVYAKKLLMYSKEINDTYGIIHSHEVLGNLEIRQNNNYERALVYFFDGVRLAESGKPYDKFESDLIHLRNKIGELYKSFELYDRAIITYNASYTRAIVAEDTLQMILSLKEVANNYQLKGDFKRALVTLELIQNLNLEYGNRRIELDNYLNQGNTYLGMKDYDKAVYCYERILRIDPGSDNHLRSIQSMAISNTAICLLNQGIVKPAVEQFRKAIRLENQIEDFAGNDPMSYYKSLKGLGDAFFTDANLDSALYQYNLTREFLETQEDQNQTEYFELYLLLAFVYERQNDLEMAYNYQKIYSEMLNSYLENQVEQENIDKKYNLELITQRYNTLVTQQEKNRKIQLYGGIIIVTFILIILGLILYNAYRRYVLKSELEKSIRILDI